MPIDLRGDNQIRKFRRVAETLISEITSVEDVIGVVFVGGLVRGFTDKYSDLDITVFLDKRNEKRRMQIHRISLNESKRSRIDIDLEIHFLNDFKKRKWDEAGKWEFSRARIAYDPKGTINKLFKQKLRVNKDFWTKRVVLCAEYLKWYCCPPKEDIGTVAEAWIERGDLIAAHYCLNYSIDLLLKLIFALNKKFLPAPKWRIHYSLQLPWQPKDYKQLIKEALETRNLTKNDLGRRLQVLRKIWRETQLKIQRETGLTAKQASKYYVEKILRQPYILANH